MTQPSGQATVIAVENPKGGTVKSTTAIHIAAGLAKRGRTLLIDTDPQETAYRWYTQFADPDDPTSVPFLVHRQTDGKMLAAEVKNKFLGDYDFIVIDTPGSLAGSIVTFATMLADHVILPTSPSGTEKASLQDTLAMVDKVNDMRETYNLPKVQLHLLLVKVELGTNAYKNIRPWLQREFGGALTPLRAEIPKRTGELGDAYGKRPVLRWYEPVLEEVLDGRTDAPPVTNDPSETEPPLDTDLQDDIRPTVPVGGGIG